MVMKVKKEELNLEALFQLKREESPDEAFWDAFDQQLQIKLAAVSLKRPFLNWGNLESIFSFKWLRWVPVTTCLCLFLTYHQISKSSKDLDSRFAFVASAIESQSIRSIPLTVDNSHFSIPNKNLISIPQKTLAKIDHTRFSF